MSQHTIIIDDLTSLTINDGEDYYDIRATPMIPSLKDRYLFAQVKELGDVYILMCWWKDMGYRLINITRVTHHV